MKNLQVSQDTFMAWAGPGQIQLDRSVVFMLEGIKPPDNIHLRRVLKALEYGEDVELLGPTGDMVARVAFTEHGYIGTWL